MRSHEYLLLNLVLLIHILHFGYNESSTLSFLFWSFLDILMHGKFFFFTSFICYFNFASEYDWMCSLCSVTMSRTGKWYLFFFLHCQSVSFNVLSLFFALCIFIVCKRRRIRLDEGEKKSNQYIQCRKAATWLSFFRPCTCALILFFLHFLFTHIWHVRENTTNFSNFFLFFFFVLFYFLKRHQQTNCTQALVWNVMGRNWFCELFVNCHETKTMMPPWPQPSSKPELENRRNNRKQAKVNFCCHWNSLFAFAFHLNRLKYKITNPIYERADPPLIFDWILYSPSVPFYIIIWFILSER